MTAGTRVVADLFRRTFGAEADGFWRAPGRLNLIVETCPACSTVNVS